MTGEQLPQTAQDDEHEEQDQDQRRWPRRTVLAGAAAATLGGGAVGTVHAAEPSTRIDELRIQPNPVPQGSRFRIIVMVCNDTDTWLPTVFSSAPAPEVDISMAIDGIDRTYRRSNRTIHDCQQTNWRLHTQHLLDDLDKHHVTVWTPHDFEEDYIEVA